MSRHQVSRRWIEEQILRVFPDILPFDLDQAFLCGELAAATHSKGLSLGDRACLATGLVHGCPVLTAEPRWMEIGWKAFGYQPEIQLIRAHGV